MNKVLCLFERCSHGLLKQGQGNLRVIDLLWSASEYVRSTTGVRRKGGRGQSQIPP